MTQTVTARPRLVGGDHPAIDPGAVDRLRRHLGRPVLPEASVDTGLPATASPDTATPDRSLGGRSLAAPDPATLSGRFRALVTRAGAPLLGRVRGELARAANAETAELHGEIDALRDELERTRAEHAAEIAVLHEQVRDRR